MSSGPSTVSRHLRTLGAWKRPAVARLGLTARGKLRIGWRREIAARERLPELSARWCFFPGETGPEFVNSGVFDFDEAPRVAAARSELRGI
jgi:hypothetical protein